VFNPRGPRGRARLIAQQIRMMAGLERTLYLNTRRTLQAIADEAAHAYENRGSIDHALTNHAPRMLQVLEAHHRSTIRVFGQRVMQSAPKSFGVRELKDADGIFSRFVQDWIDRYTASKVTRILDTTRAQIVEAIAEGEQGGIGVQATAKLIRDKTGGAIARSRASIIARTETHQAAMYGSEKAADALDIPEMKKEWLAVEDERTRPAHSAANGQTVPVEGQFDVGGESLDRPGDPDASPENTINCRCVQAYVTPGFE
jgi:SPP1 gp7 family putative phage head morphogenesis protein